MHRSIERKLQYQLPILSKPFAYLWLQFLLSKTRTSFFFKGNFQVTLMDLNDSIDSFPLRDKTAMLVHKTIANYGSWFA